LLLASRTLFERTFDPIVSNGRLVSPEHGQSLYEKVTFSWTAPLLALGLERPLQDTDIWNLIPEDQAQAAYDLFLASKSHTRTFLWTLIHTVRWDLFFQFTSAICYSFCLFLPSYFLNQILLYIQGDDQTSTQVDAYGKVILLLLATLMTVVFNQQCYMYGRHANFKARAIIGSLLFSKSLKRRLLTTDTPKDIIVVEDDVTGEDEEDLDTSTVGRVINLLQVDQSKISEGAAYIHWIVELPVQLVFGFTYLYVLLGNSVLFAFIGIAVMYPLTWKVCSKYDAIRDRVMKHADKRVDAINEMMQAIRMVKLFAWERNLTNKITERRELELKAVWDEQVNVMQFIVISYFGPILIL
jgi:ABC-type multidrug transport system fused ATPase/permease subunit